jgi:molybdenum cofactor cytidylyltransferase
VTCTIILAAGNSRRMGTQKLLLPVAGQPAIACVVHAVAASAGIDRIIVVTGRDGPALLDALTRHELHFAENPDRDGDMLSSVRCGLRALPAACTSILVVLGDQPGLTPALIASLVSAQRDRGASIVVPVAADRRGHPILLSVRHREEILAQFDGTGLRGLLAAHPDDVLEVPVPVEAGLLEDMDTPEDYARIKAHAEPPSRQ